MANNALPLPHPYLPGEQTPDSFEDRTQQNMDALAVALGGLFGSRTYGIRVGSGTATWAGGTASSNVVVIPHGLGVVPVAVSITAGGGVGAGGWVPIGAAFTLTSSNFSVVMQANGMNTPAGGTTGTFYWIAIG